MADTFGYGTEEVHSLPDIEDAPSIDPGPEADDPLSDTEADISDVLPDEADVEDPDANA